MSGLGVLKIDDLEFEVIRCDLVAFTGGPDEDDLHLYWGFEIECEERSLLDDHWKPKATCDRAFSTGPGELGSWTDLLPREVEVADFPDPDQPEDPGALLYVWSHEPIRSCCMTLGPASGGCFPFRWTGRTDVNFNDQYGSDLAFEVEAVARFAGVPMGRCSEAEAREELSQFMDLDHLSYVLDEHGVSRFVPDLTGHPALSRPEFWLSLMAVGFGGLGPEPDREVVAKALGIGSREGAAWWDDFVGYQAGMLDKPLAPGEDGILKPTTITFPLQSGFDLLLDCFPDSVLSYALRHGEGKVMLGETGGHFRVPALRWNEAVDLRAALTDADLGSKMLLAMLPAIYLTTDEDHAAALPAVESAWLATGLASQQGAKVLAQQWAAATDLRGKHSWREVEGVGWVTDAHWSVRGDASDDARAANKLIVRAVGGA